MLLCLIFVADIQIKLHELKHGIHIVGEFIQYLKIDFFSAVVLPCHHKLRCLLSEYLLFIILRRESAKE